MFDGFFAEMRHTDVAIRAAVAAARVWAWLRGEFARLSTRFVAYLTWVSPLLLGMWCLVRAVGEKEIRPREEDWWCVVSKPRSCDKVVPNRVQVYWPWACTQDQFYARQPERPSQIHQPECLSPDSPTSKHHQTLSIVILRPLLEPPNCPSRLKKEHLHIQPEEPYNQLYKATKSSTTPPNVSVVMSGYESSKSRHPFYFHDGTPGFAAAAEDRRRALRELKIDEPFIGSSPVKQSRVRFA